MKTIKEFVNQKNSNTFAHKLQIFLKILICSLVHKKGQKTNK